MQRAAPAQGNRDKDSQAGLIRKSRPNLRQYFNCNWWNFEWEGLAFFRTSVIVIYLLHGFRDPLSDALLDILLKNASVAETKLWPYSSKNGNALPPPLGPQEIWLAQEARGLHRRPPRRQGGAATPGGRGEGKRPPAAAALRHIRLHTVSALLKVIFEIQIWK